jgi:hypothetical protein
MMALVYAAIGLGVIGLASWRSGFQPALPAFAAFDLEYFIHIEPPTGVVYFSHCLQGDRP